MQGCESAETLLSRFSKMRMFLQELLCGFMVMALSESGGASQQGNESGQLMAKQIERRDLSL